VALAGYMPADVRSKCTGVNGLRGCADTALRNADEDGIRATNLIETLPCWHRYAAGPQGMADGVSVTQSIGD
jgi:hypothetical protein